MNGKEQQAWLGCVGIALGLPLLMFVTGFLKAFVARQLWIWFAQPVFLLAPPSYGYMYGLALFVGALWPSPQIPKETDNKWWLPFVGYPLVLLVGYITHWLVIR